MVGEFRSVKRGIGELYNLNCAHVVVLALKASGRRRANRDIEPCKAESCSRDRDRQPLNRIQHRNHPRNRYRFSGRWIHSWLPLG